MYRVFLKIKKNFFLSLFFCCFVFSHFYLKANFGYTMEGYESSGMLKPYGLNQVEVEYEQLDIELRDTKAVVSIKYILHNTSSSTVVQAGFPSKYYYGVTDVVDYSIKVDNKSIPYIRDKAKIKNVWQQDHPIQSEWIVSKIHFRENEKHEVTIHYDSPYVDDNYGGVYYQESKPLEFRYILSTGGAWKGGIKKGNITIKTVGWDPKDVHITPVNRFSLKNSIFTWNFENLRPTLKDDIAITLGESWVYSAVLSPEKDVVSNVHYILYKNRYFVHFSPDKVKATSTLKKNTKDYLPENVDEMSFDKAWVPEHGKKGNGIGESITLVYQKPYPIIDSFLIYPGYSKSFDLYQSNNRVAEVEVLLNNKYKKNYFLPDVPGKKHELSVSDFKQPVSEAKFTILKIHKGTKYSDTPISEIVGRKHLKKRPKVFNSR